MGSVMLFNIMLVVYITVLVVSAAYVWADWRRL